MSLPLKIYIVEDMAISRTSLETMLSRNNYHVVGSAAKAEVAWEEIKKNKIDLVLLDINLAGVKNGVWLARKIRKHLNFPIIYLTAYGDQQTLKEVIETKPNGYLMKPYQEPNLIATIEIAVSNFYKNKALNKAATSLSDLANFIFIKDRYSKVKLYFDSILFVMSDGNYIDIILENKKHVVRSKLSDFYQQLPKDIFYQTHQRYLVNIEKVDVIKKDAFKIKDDEIPISQKYKKELEKIFSNL